MRSKVALVVVVGIMLLVLALGRAFLGAHHNKRGVMSEETRGIVTFDCGNAVVAAIEIGVAVFPNDTAGTAPLRVTPFSRVDDNFGDVRWVEFSSKRQITAAQGKEKLSASLAIWHRVAGSIEVKSISPFVEFFSSDSQLSSSKAMLPISVEDSRIHCGNWVGIQGYRRGDFVVVYYIALIDNTGRNITRNCMPRLVWGPIPNFLHNERPEKARE